jgi:hypothetical protein
MDLQTILASLITAVGDFNVGAQELGKQTDINIIAEQVDETLATLEELKCAFEQVRQHILDSRKTAP